MEVDSAFLQKSLCLLPITSKGVGLLIIRSFMESCSFREVFSPSPNSGRTLTNSSLWEAISPDPNSGPVCTIGVSGFVILVVIIQGLLELSLVGLSVASRFWVLIASDNTESNCSG